MRTLSLAGSQVNPDRFLSLHESDSFRPRPRASIRVAEILRRIPKSKYPQLLRDFIRFRTHEILATVEGNEIPIQIRENVFVPTENAYQFLRHLPQFVKGNVVDIGTGTGLFAIAAKKLGAESVLGIDVSPHSLKLASRNARTNDVEVDFDTPERLQTEASFDVALLNLPQTPSMDICGENGNQLLIEYLSLISKKMNPNGVILTPLVSYSAPQETLDFGESVFEQSQELSCHFLPLPEYISPEIALSIWKKNPDSFFRKSDESFFPIASEDELFTLLKENKVFSKNSIVSFSFNPQQAD